MDSGKPPTDPPSPPSPRDLRLDLIRGAALLCMHTDHFRHNELGRWTPRNFGHSALKPTAFLNDMRNSSRPECSVSNRIVFFIRGPALPSAVSHLLTTDGKAGPRMKKDSCGL